MMYDELYTESLERAMAIEINKEILDYMYTIRYKKRLCNTRIPYIYKEIVYHA